MATMVTGGDVREACRRAGVRPGDALIVHASLSRLGYVIGGAETVVRALLDCVGPAGTLLAPAQTWLNLDPERGVHGVPPDAWDLIRREWPPYDKHVTPSIGMGAVAEAVRTWPGAVRSDHPARSWSAVGAAAQALMREHDLDDVHGEASPLGALYRSGGGILLIGVDYDKCTALHLAETRADYAGKGYTSETSWIAAAGERRAVTYHNLAFDDGDFVDIGRAYERVHGGQPTMLGDGTVRHIDVVAFVDFAQAWMEANRREGTG